MSNVLKVNFLGEDVDDVLNHIVNIKTKEEAEKFYDAILLAIHKIFEELK